MFFKDHKNLPKRLFLVDDDSEFLAYFLSLTDPYNLMFDICSNLQVAQQKIRSLTYDAYIIDLNLPDGSGLDLIQEIRNKKGYQYPIGVISGFYKDEHMFKLLKDKYFIDYVLDKPIYPQQIDELLINLCLLSSAKEPVKAPDQLQEIRKKYMSTITDKVVLISDLTKSVEKKADTKSLTQLKDAVHKIAGSAGSYGFPDVSHLCKELEFCIDQQLSSKTFTEKEWKELLNAFMGKIKYSFQFPVTGDQDEALALPSDISRPSLYVIDNDAQFLELLQREKQEFAIDVHVESSPEKACARLKSAEFNPRIIIASKTFFGSQINAFDIFEVIRNKKNAPSTIFSIILEKNNDIDNRIDITRRDVKYVFHKPISARLLLKAMSDALETRFLKHFKVLILDDDPNICDFISMSLKEIGIESRTLEDPSLLYKTLEEYAPDLLFLDIVFPRHDGFDLLKTIRSDVLYMNLIVVIITAHRESDTDTQIHSYSENADEIFYKPLNKSVLQRRVLNLARRAALEHSSTIHESIGLGSFKMLLNRLHEITIDSNQFYHLVLFSIDNYDNLVLCYGQTAINDLMILISNSLQKIENSRMSSYFFCPYFSIIFRNYNENILEKKMYDLLNSIRLQNHFEVGFCCSIIPITKDLGNNHEIVQIAKKALGEINPKEDSPIKIVSPLLSQERSLHKKTLILIEPDADLLYILKNAFDTQGVLIKTFDEGKKALEELLNNEETPALIIAERKLPDMDGIEILKSLKARFKAHIPFYFLTDYVSEKDVIQGLKYGASEYITKPFNLSFLVQKSIKKIFE